MHCKITDSGIGISEDKVNKLFGRLIQVDASTTRKYGGTGLGLAIAKKLVHLMQGEILVSSQFGVGSCFEFTIEVEYSELSQKIQPCNNISNLQLLVITSNARNREVLQAQLQHWGALTDSANTAEQALQLCLNRVKHAAPASRIYDIVYVDSSLSDMDGSEFAKAIRENSALDEMKLVMMSTINNNRDNRYYSELGFNAHFLKPVNIQNLSNTLLLINNEAAPSTKQETAVTDQYLSSLMDNEIQQQQKIIAEQFPDNYRILLVEDNQINQMVASGIIERFGFKVDIVANGLEALTSLVHSPDNAAYAIIFMDCQMPEMDGYQATQDIRAGKAGNRYRSIPIIALTANVMQGDKKKCIAIGMSDYLSKPIDPDKLHDILKFWINAINDNSSKNSIPQQMNPNITTIEAEPNATQESDMKLTTGQAASNEKNSTYSVWDKDSALNRISGQTEVFLQIIEIFLQDIPKQINSLQAALEHENWQDAKLAAHTIKGSAANMSCDQLKQVAEQLENKMSAKQHDMDSIQQQMQKLIDANKHIREIMQQYQDESA